MFNTLIVQPVFNLLVLIYALLPGHNFGVAIILFTIVVRLAMWPLVKKQLHHAKAMRELQPELKRIKKQAKGDRALESTMVMALYKEKEINPFASIGLLIVQIPIFIALYSGIRRIVDDPHSIYDFTYAFIQKFPSVQELSTDVSSFDATLFGIIDLTRPAVGPLGFYLPAFLIVLASAVTQFYQSKMLMPDDKEAKGIKDILKSASDGKQADQSEVNAAIGRSTKYLIPGMVFIFTIGLPSALSLYWLTSGLVALYQQNRVLKQDVTELEDMSDKPSAKERAKVAKEAVVVKGPKKKKTKNKRKRR
jgi:YidC/Oxa1 family membrane protein insertase